MERVIDTAIAVIAAIVIVGGIWVVLNLLVDQAEKGWARYLGLAGALLAAIGFSATRGNLVLRSLILPEDDGLLGAAAGWPGRLEWPIFGALVWGVGLFLIAKAPQLVVRLAIGAVIGIGTGLAIGFNLQVWQRPEIAWPTVILAVIIGVAVTAGSAMAREFRSSGSAIGPNGLPIPSIVTGAFVGWVVGAWFLSDFHEFVNNGALIDGIIASSVALVLLAWRIGWSGEPGTAKLSLFDTRARAAIFLGPAMLFLSAALIIPALRTIGLSFQSRDSSEFVGFENYQTLWNDADSFNFENWRSVFSSSLFTLAFFLIAVGLLAGFVTFSKRNNTGLLGGGVSSVTGLGLAGVFAVLAVFSIFLSNEPDEQTGALDATTEAWNGISWLPLVLGLFLLVGLASLFLTGKQFTFTNELPAGLVALAVISVVTGIITAINGSLFDNGAWLPIAIVILAVVGFVLSRIYPLLTPVKGVGIMVAFAPLAALSPTLLVFGLVGLGIAMASGPLNSEDATFERSGLSIAAVVAGLFLFSFAVLSVVRGTFFNNIWWVITVTSLSVILGLLIAVLADGRGRVESVAKSLIFMPLAISFVGASIVWRLQYQPRLPATNTQTGVLNAVWVELGRLSHSGVPRVIALVVLATLFAAIAYKVLARYQVKREFGAGAAALIPVGYLFVEIARRSLGGFEIVDGEVRPEVVRFLNEAPFNNVFMMIILIWIQTGFAMVILSAAIKAVPQEFIEAARVDGADESQTFFRVTLPQILPTVGVVTTTLIVLVTKVFDIVLVTTGGNFGTNVLANDMFVVSFSNFNTGLGSAIAVFILISVLPVMFLNVRRMQEQRAVNK